MTNIQNEMKYSIIYGFIGAVLLPFIHESYANIGKTFSLLVLSALVLAMTVRLSQFSFKEALLGITVTLAVSSVLGACLYLFIHQKVVDFLERNSKYFALEMTEHFRYYVSVLLILLSGYVVCLIIFGFKGLFRKFRDNQTAVKDYIDNAFDDVNFDSVNSNEDNQ